MARVLLFRLGFTREDERNWNGSWRVMSVRTRESLPRSSGKIPLGKSAALSRQYRRVQGDQPQDTGRIERRQDRSSSTCLVTLCCTRRCPFKLKFDRGRWEDGARLLIVATPGERCAPGRKTWRSSAERTTLRAFSRYCIGSAGCEFLGGGIVMRPVADENWSPC